MFSLCLIYEESLLFFRLLDFSSGQFLLRLLFGIRLRSAAPRAPRLVEIKPFSAFLTNHFSLTVKFLHLFGNFGVIAFIDNINCPMLAENKFFAAEARGLNLIKFAPVERKCLLAIIGP